MIPSRLYGLLLFALVATGAWADIKSYTEHPTAIGFIDELVREDGFERAALVELFAKIKYRPASVSNTQAPAEAKPWKDYRPILVNPQRIKQGVRFWREHEESLQRAEREYGVPAALLVAMIGVETRYGRVVGRHPVLDSLATLAFDYPNADGSRGLAYFRNEVRHLLLLAREQQLAPLGLRGSYAGAMGYVQFMPSSYRAYAVDFDADGRIDIWNNWEDAIGSVANYFKQNGWRPGAPIARRAEVKGDAYKEQLAVAKADLKPNIKLERWAALGVVLEASDNPDSPAILLELEAEGGLEHWLGLHNFYVISRYNPNAHYAMATYQLSQELARVRNRR